MKKYGVSEEHLINIYYIVVLKEISHPHDHEISYDVEPTKPDLPFALTQKLIE